MTEFLVEKTFEVYSLDDWKIRAEITIKLQVETTIKVKSPKDWKFKVKKLNEKWRKFFIDSQNFLERDVWRLKKDKRKKVEGEGREEVSES